MLKNCFNQEELKIISKNFSKEIEESREGKKTSLQYIPHEISTVPLVKENECFQALIIGGSVLKSALLKKTDNEIIVLQIEKEKNISLVNDINFFDLIFRELSPNTTILALNLAYPLRPVFEKNKLDGIFLESTKETRLQGLIGRKIGKEIEDYIFKKLKRQIQVSVANDVICLILSGLCKFKWDNLAGGVVGTGVNFSLFTDANKIINLESSGFDKFTQTHEGKIVDQKSDGPGKFLFEKETSGKYLYRHFNVILKEENISFPPISSTEELNVISLKNIPQISDIARNLMTRSAQLVACQIAGIMSFKKRNMIFIMEGSLFWKGNNYKETVTETIKKLEPKYKVNFVKIENSSILGAAKLVC